MYTLHIYTHTRTKRYLQIIISGTQIHVFSDIRTIFLLIQNVHIMFLDKNTV